MASDELPDGNRATVALVYRTVDDLGKRMDTHFDGVKQRLDRLEPVEDRVTGHDQILANHEVRLLTVEAAQKELEASQKVEAGERVVWYRAQLPTICFSALALTAAILIPILT